MSYSLQQTVNYALTYVNYSPLTAGAGGDPAVTIANIVLSTLTSAPLTWPWNRAEYTGLTLTADTQDYNTVEITDFSFLEKVSLKNPKGDYSYELKDVYNTNILGVSVGPSAQPQSVAVKYVMFGTSLALRFLAPPDLAYTSVLTYQKLLPAFTYTKQVGSQQTGTGIPAATVLETGSVLTFNDGVNSFTFVSTPSQTLSALVTAINATTTFSATLNNTLLVITAASGFNINIVANTLTDASTGLLSETFVASAMQSLLTQNWPVPDQYVDIYNTLFLAEAFQAVGDDQEAQKYRVRGIAALLSKAEGLNEMQRNAFLSQYLVRGAQAQSLQLRTTQGNQARGV